MSAPHNEAVTQGPLAAGNGTPFQLMGGVYDLLAVAVAFGTGGIDFQTLGPDGTTWVSHLAATFAANGVKDAQYLSPGQYRWVVGATGSGAYLCVARVPV